jgi:hypothetical protein
VLFGHGQPPAVAFEYKDEFGLKLHQEILFTAGVRGTHNRPSERTRLGNRRCSGPVHFEPGPADLDTLLPLITDSNVNGANQCPLAETLLPFNTVVDRVTKVMT